MQPAQLHEDEFLRIFWDSQTRIIGIDWKEATSEMTDEDGAFASKGERTAVFHAIGEWQLRFS